jgi:hypothetical protein
MGLGLVVAEVLLQLAPYDVLSYPLYQSDETLGAVLRPNLGGWQTQEGRVFVRTNADGFRDRPWTAAKPAGTYRIAVLGDSYAEAAQVERDEAFWAVMEREVARCLPASYRRVEVLNFGVSGYGTGQELLMLREKVWDYDPDLVLLAFLPANDVRNNSRALEPQDQRPFFELQDDELVLDNAFRQDPDWERMHRSGWVRFKDWVIRHVELAALVYQFRHRPAAPPAAARDGLVELGLSREIYRPPQDAAWQEAWEVTDRLLMTMHQEVTARDLPFLVRGVTSGVVVRPEPEPRRTLRAALGVEDLLYADRRIAELGAREGFPVVLLSEAMQQVAEKEGTYFHGFANTEWGTGHWNAAGHAFAGQQLAEVICAENLWERDR